MIWGVVLGLDVPLRLASDDDWWNISIQAIGSAVFITIGVLRLRWSRSAHARSAGRAGGDSRGRP